jgi:phosphoribosyl-AMP cyclohydrolase
MSLTKELKFDARGLLPVVAQDAFSGRVLMMAWMNPEAFRTTLKTGYAHYYSRSRKRLWKKGETSGHVQKVVDMLLDCDGDTLLLKVKQTGPACHTNRPSCFYRKWQDDRWIITDEPIK